MHRETGRETKTERDSDKKRERPIIVVLPEWKCLEQHILSSSAFSLGRGVTERGGEGRKREERKGEKGE